MCWIRSKVQLNVPCYSVYTNMCTHTLFLAGGSDVSEVGLEEIAFPCLSWHSVLGHPQAWHLLSKVSSWEVSLSKCLILPVTIARNRTLLLSVETELPCADAEECRGSSPNMLCMVAHSICSSMVVLLSFMLTSNEFL